MSKKVKPLKTPLMLCLQDAVDVLTGIALRDAKLLTKATEKELRGIVLVDIIDAKKVISKLKKIADEKNA